MIEILRREFVPVAGNLRDLYGPQTPVANWFDALARKVNYKARSGETAEGYYAFAPDGTPFAFTDWQDVEKVLEVLREGRRLAASTRAKDEDLPLAGSPRDVVPGEASVLRTYARVRPVPSGAPPINASVGRDQMWVLGDEVRAMAASPLGAWAPAPPTLTARLARFHLIDNVRGEPDLWRPTEVERAVLEIKRASGDRFELRGSFAQSSASGDRGQEGGIEGEFSLDRPAMAIGRFRALFEGSAWGSAVGSKCTELAPKGRYPLVIAIVDAEDPVSRLVPPQGASLGGEYLRPTVGRSDR